MGKHAVRAREMAKWHYSGGKKNKLQVEKVGFLNLPVFSLHLCAMGNQTPERDLD